MTILIELLPNVLSAWFWLYAFTAFIVSALIGLLNYLLFDEEFTYEGRFFLINLVGWLFCQGKLGGLF